MAIDRRQVVKGAVGLAAAAFAPKLLAVGDSDKPLTCFAFGSCNRSTSDQSYWLNIAKDNPELWIWMGDNLYADGTTISQRKYMYDSLKANKYYDTFRFHTPIIGTWDDHDFWSNNRDGSFPEKDQSKALALSFLDTDPARVAGHEGIYQSYTFGPESQRTKVILLDLRFNMIQQRAKPSQLLGIKQWAWFLDEIMDHTYELLIIGSSQNVLSPSGPQAWASFPAERTELYHVMQHVECPVLFLSGDRHYGDFSKLDIGGKTVYEFMSSGLTHYNPIGRSNPNRIGKSVRAKNYGLVSIDWNGAQPALTLQLKAPDSGKVLQETKIE